jgi:hypothetical protein
MSGAPSPDPLEAWRDLSARAARASSVQASAAIRSERPRAAAAAVGVGAVLLAVVIVGVALTLRPSTAPSASDAVAASPSASAAASSGPVTSSADDGMFRLELRTPKGRYTDLDAIEPVATITYLGPDAVAIVTHGAKPVGFRIEQLDGKRVMDGGMDSVCTSSVLDKDRPIDGPFEKAGQPTDDTVLGFDAAWYGDKTLRLPPGDWRITATLQVTTGGCGGTEHTLNVSNDIHVVPAERGPGPVTESADDGAFRFELTTPHGVYAPDMPIEPIATVTFLGPEASATMFHGGSIVLFSLEEVGGTRRMEGGMTTPCIRTSIARGQELSFPFVKSGAIGTTAPFDSTWFQDPALRLPTGTWRIRAQLIVSTGGSDACGGVSHDLAADNVVIVTDGAQPSVAPSVPEPEIQPSPSLAPPNPEPEPSVAPSIVEDGTFRLEISTARKDYLASDPLEFSATLTYLGPDASVTFGHGDPAVGFSIEQLDGPEVMSGLTADVCLSTTLARGQPLQVPFGRSGGVQGIFTEEWYRAPEVHLPPGIWRISAMLEAYIPECSLQAEVHRPRADVVIIVH